MSDQTTLPPETRRRPLEELLSESEEMMKKYGASFTKLPAIERLIDVWSAKAGIAHDDPIMVIPEMLGLFEIRQREAMSGLVEIVRQQNEINATMVTELEERLTELRELRQTVAEFHLVINAQKKSEDELVEINSQFLEVVPDVMEAIHSAAKMINDKSWRSYVIEYGSNIAAIVAGLLIGHYLI